MSGRYERIASHTKRKKKENEEKEEQECGEATERQQWIFFLDKISWGQRTVRGGLRFSERKQTDVYCVYCGSERYENVFVGMLL